MVKGPGAAGIQKAYTHTHTYICACARSVTVRETMMLFVPGAAQKKAGFHSALKYSLSENGRLSGNVYSLRHLFPFPLILSRPQGPRNAVPRRVKTRHYISGRGIRPREGKRVMRRKTGRGEVSEGEVESPARNSISCYSSGVMSRMSPHPLSSYPLPPLILRSSLQPRSR